MVFFIPVRSEYWISQTFDQHVARRIANGWPPGSYNGGVDYAIAEGTPVHATAPGKVVVKRQDKAGYGWHVRVEHEDGFLSIYAHLSRFAVEVGDQVQAGYVLGFSGNTGNSTGPHLHFEVRKNGLEFNPEPFLQPLGDPDGQTGSRPAEFPVLPKVQVRAGVTLRVRSGPGSTYPIVQAVKSTDGPLEVLELLEKSAGEAWLRIGFKQYVAEVFSGVRYVDWL